LTHGVDNITSDRSTIEDFAAVPHIWHRHHYHILQPQQLWQYEIVEGRLLKVPNEEIEAGESNVCLFSSPKFVQLRVISWKEDGISTDKDSSS
jgi:hypothetical protein